VGVRAGARTWAVCWVDRVFVPLHILTGTGELRLLNMVATFGTALDVTAAELVIDTFYPADPSTAHTLGNPRLTSTY
jgi:hypothetical protein